MESNGFSITLKICKYALGESEGHFQVYKIDNVIAEMSFLEMLDVLNEKLLKEWKEPVAVESDCREGICGCCGLVINGDLHGPDEHSTVCQLYMRRFKEGDIITIESFRAKSFPHIKDLVIDRSALDKIIAAGRYISVNTASKPEANSLPVSKHLSEKDMNAAACISCDTYVVVYSNSTAILFTAAKISHLAFYLKANRKRHMRVLNMIRAMDSLGFGNY